MGTIPLVESFTDIRNLATIATHGTILGLLATATLTRNRQTSVILIMVITTIFKNEKHFSSDRFLR